MVIMIIKGQIKKAGEANKLYCLFQSDILYMI
jgi:hypothetical protein